MRVNIICAESVVQAICNTRPQGCAIGEDVELYFNQEDDAYDGVIVLQSTKGLGRMNVKCRKGNAVLVVYEPASLLKMHSDYLDQFDYIFSPNNSVRGREVIHTCFWQVWSMDLTVENLRSMTPSLGKMDKVSAVISSKAVTRGHKKRLNFVYALKEELGDLFDWYGKGIREVDDKWDAISPYKYHLAFENGKWANYWTEKLTDSYMGYALPIYVGCPNVTDYLDARSFVSLDDRDPRLAAKQIRKLIEEDAYNDSVLHLQASREKILDKYSLYPSLCDCVRKYFNADQSGYKTIDLSKFKNTVDRYNIYKYLKRVKRSLKKGGV